MGLLNGAVYVTVLSRLWSRSVAYGTCRRPGGSVRAWYEVLSAGPVIGFACGDSPALRTHWRGGCGCCGSAPRTPKAHGMPQEQTTTTQRGFAVAARAERDAGSSRSAVLRHVERCCVASSCVAAVGAPRRPTRLVCSVGGDGAERRGLLVVFAARVHAPQRGLHADVDAPASRKRARTLQQTPAEIGCVLHIGCVFIPVARCVSVACWIFG